MLELLQPYVTDKSVALTNILGFLASDQAVGFFQAPFHMQRGSKWSTDHGLYLASTNGIPALMGFMKVARALYDADLKIDHMVSLYLSVMLGRWADLSSGRMIYADPGERQAAGSMDTVSIVNATIFGVCPMGVADVQALSLWSLSKADLHARRDGFHSEWWVMHETMYWLMVKGTSE